MKVTLASSSMFIFQVSFFSLFKYNPQYYFLALVFIVLLVCHFQVFDYALIFCTEFCSSSLLCIATIHWLLIMHCCFLLPLIPCCYVLLPFFKFTLLGVIVHCCWALLFFIIVRCYHFSIPHAYALHHSPRHLFELLLFLGSSLMRIVVIPPRCCGLVTSIWYNPQPLLLSK